MKNTRCAKRLTLPVALMIGTMLATVTWPHETSAQETPPCSAGQAVSPDTAGHCCWPAQAWSVSRKVCVGIPQCPADTHPEAERCVSTCRDGTSITDETAGHCCWPGQVWAAGTQRCVGIPSCPGQFVLQGESCVRSSATATAVAPPPPPLAPAAAPSSAIPSQQTNAGPSASSSSEAASKPAVSRPRMGLVITGASLLGAGYVVSAGIGIGGQTYAASNKDGGCWSGMGAWPYVPIIGAIGSILTLNGRYSYSPGGVACTNVGSGVVYYGGVVVAILDTILQVGGSGLLVFGLVSRTHEQGHALRSISGGDGIRWTLLPGAPGAPAGLTLALDGF